MKKTKWIIALTVALFSFALSRVVTQSSFSSEVVVEDLRFIQQTLLAVHPDFAEQEKQTAFNAYVESIIGEITGDVTKDQAAILAQKIVTWLKSSHDHVELKMSEQYLPLVFYWASDGLLVFANEDSILGIPPASEVLKIGDVGVDSLELKLQQLISGNRYTVRKKAAQLLSTRGILSYLGAIDEVDRVSLVIRTPESEERTIATTFTEEIGKTRWMGFLSTVYNPAWVIDESTRIFAWKVDGEANQAIFKLYTCDNSKIYQNTVQNFFEAIEQAKVTNLVIDLRGNSGGDSSVVYAFLSYFPVDELKNLTGLQRVNETIINRVRELSAKDKVYETLLNAFVLLSSQDDAREGDIYFSDPSQSTLENERLEPTFNGKTYILVDGETFSAAIDFATMFSDNHLAIIVGEPVGDAPTSSGNVIRFETPNLGISFWVSSSFYVRPDPNRDPADTLEPDIYLPLTVKDIQQKHDPIKTWLEGLE